MIHRIPKLKYNRKTRRLRVKSCNKNFQMKEDARRFKMHRESKAASKLKSAISNKLRHFLPNYSDDVLAEYITVLVCNGKDQYQARDDLDAFLGETTFEFVSWLWGYLLEYSFETNEYLGFSRTKPPTATDRDKDSTIDNSSHNLLTNRLPSSLCGSLLSNNMEFADASTRHPGFVPDKLLSKTFENESLTFQYFVNGSSTVIQANNRQQQIVCLDKPKKHTVHRDELSYLLKRVPISRNLQSSPSEYHCLKQICANNVSPPSTGALSRQNGKSRGSVWDRLGKPCDNTSARSEITEAHCIGATKQDKKVLNQQTLMLPMLNGKPCRRILLGPGQRNRSTGNYCSKSRNMECGVSMICKPHSANTTGQKRHFDEISSGPATAAAVADSLVGERGMDHQNKEISEEVKKSIVAVKDSKTTSDIGSETLDLKQKVHQIEMEMSKLRSKQAEKRKGVKPNSSSHSDTVRHQEKDVESRTVFVTNVHFAASEQVLSLYFAKCGTVDNVVILTNKATAQPKGSAYVTFASEESVDKALGLSRTSFFSRIIKVVRKAEADSVAAAPTQLALSQSQAPVSYLSRKAIPGKPYYSSGHMQWRRDSNSTLSDPYAPLIFAGKEMSSSSQ